MATNGISKGTAAGIGVGAGLSGVMIGWLAFFFGRRDRFDRGLAVAKPPHPLPEQLGAIYSNVEQLNGNLLDGRGDSEVIDALHSLGFLIQQHVESNYHLGAIPPARDSLDRSLGQLGLREDTRNVVVILALDPRTRFVAIRHLLAHVIFSNLDFHSLGPLSLLPPAVNTFIQSLPQTNIYARTTLGNYFLESPAVSLCLPQITNAASTALISWRRLTAFLMHQDFQSRSPLLPPPSLENQINELVIELGCFLSNFVDNARASEQKSRLESVIRACVRFGYEIFSHPCEWRFTFETETQNEVMVLPGLEKLSNREGELYEVPMKVALPEIVVEDIMRV